MAGAILLGIDVETVAGSGVYARQGPELLAAEGIQATWYVTGRALEAHSAAFRAADKSGVVDLQIHTYDHMLFKTVLIEVPADCTVHKTQGPGWYLRRAGTNEQIDLDLRRCCRVYEDVLGRRPLGLTTPWGYYRGLADRPDLLEIVHAHGLRWTRSYARNERDGQPVAMELQPFFYAVQGFPDILELPCNDYQDDFYYIAFNGLADAATYPAHLHQMAERVAKENLVWNLCSHDHSCATPEDFRTKTAWLVNLIRYAKRLGIEFVTGAEYYQRMLSARATQA